MSDATIDRRQFISTGIGLAAALAPAGLRARGPNDRIGIGIIGCGSRGNYLLGETLAAAADRVDIVALADVWTVARDAMAHRVASTGGRAAPKLFARYPDLLAMPQVDAVIIATPDFAHPGVLVDAVKAGKDAFVEKPLSARLEDAVTALDAVTAQLAHRAGGHAAPQQRAVQGRRGVRALGCARPDLQDRDGVEPQRPELGRGPWTTFAPRTSIGSSSRCTWSGGRSTRCGCAAGNGSTSRPPGSSGCSAAT